MSLYYACNANVPEGEPITPKSRGRVQEGKFFVPDCPDYESKFGLPSKVKLKTVYTGWSCHNCVHLMESREPFQGPGHHTYTAQQPAEWKMAAPGRPADAPAPDPVADATSDITDA